MAPATGLDDNPFLSLGTVALSPPHRHLSPAYSSLVTSPSWLARYDILQHLGDPPGPGAGGGTFAGGGHRVVREAYGSTGCVNAMAWEEGGNQARLATAGDDTKICIWSPGLDTPHNSQNGPVISPAPGYGLAETIATGHRGNVFSLKWAPNLASRLISCAADAQVRVYDLSSTTNPRLNPSTVTPPPDSPHQPWVHHEPSTACTTVLRCHTDRVKRIATEASSDVFLTCAEDGTVRQHDLRTHHVCRRNRFDNDPGDSTCPPPLVSYGPGLSLYSLTISKMRPHLFVVAGTSPFAYLHDRRMVGRTMQRDWHLAPSSLSPSSSLTQCVRRFGLPDDPDPYAHIVAAKLSPTRPRDLLVSYSAKGIYLFDTDADTVEELELADEKEERKGIGREREREEDESDYESDDEVFGVEGGVRPAAVERPAKRTRDTTAPQTLAAPSSPTVGPSQPPKRAREEVEGQGPAAVGGSIGSRDAESEGEVDEGPDELSEGEQASTDEDGWALEGDDDEPADDPYAGEPMYHPEAPLVGPVKHYTGLANTQTVKDVNFLTPDLVISGSDDGNFFIWDRESEEIKAIYKGDDDVVNVMQPHPRLPLVAISGIDSTPKLFGPTTDAAAASRANLVRDVERIKRRNASGETDRRSRLGMGGLGGITRDELLNLLFARGAAAFDDGQDEVTGDSSYFYCMPERKGAP
ncbi:uncharacterized protein RHOBADRAFT_56528 [Rhodotorula graminis WP1]|uniref:Uncharacterized protein n=1 Tax=Rhodotorula graminis (strain WP1) TaxID=578459 RepID=A0A0P9EJ72_RHOGW|nr:uncharacterized protein RHOBADRAFT_56528 [Rhodotorula graminis WP1]KPV71705.1 hypothetical protein RHOBADRAFT_56528 [Rhodotorula graminis WP1]